ncbi:MAG: hypothetical protein HY908_02745 [Myxococcales bacterium]|nr:hypothetical protein [Myxococcales bacterium]
MRIVPSAERDAVKEDFLDVYAKIAAGVRGLYPRDRTTQDLFFDEVTSSADVEVDEPDEPDAPAPADPTKEG